MPEVPPLLQSHELPADPGSRREGRLVVLQEPGSPKWLVLPTPGCGSAPEPGLESNPRPGGQEAQLACGPARCPDPSWARGLVPCRTWVPVVWDPGTSTHRLRVQQSPLPGSWVPTAELQTPGCPFQGGDRAVSLVMAVFSPFAKADTGSQGASGRGLQGGSCHPRHEVGGKDTALHLGHARARASPAARGGRGGWLGRAQSGRNGNPGRIGATELSNSGTPLLLRC